MVYSQTSFHHVRPGVSYLSNNNYCVNAAPCRWLAWVKESVKCEKLYQPHQTTTRTERLLTWIIVTRPVSGGTENVCQTTKCPKCDPQSACRSQTKSVLGTLEALGAVP